MSPAPVVIGVASAPQAPELVARLSAMDGVTARVIDGAAPANRGLARSAFDALEHRIAGVSHAGAPAGMPAGTLDVGVVLHAGASPPGPVPRAGWWHLRVGADGDGAWEVAERSPTTEVTLEARRPGRPPVVLEQAVVATVRRAVAANRHQAVHMAWVLVQRALHRLRGSAMDSLFEEAQPATPLRPPPRGRDLVRLVGRQALDLGRRRRDQRRHVEPWTLLVHAAATPRTTPCLDPRRFTRLRPPPDRFWADPHVMERDGTWWVFFEDAPMPDGRGHIAVLGLDAHGTIRTPPRPVLERPYHLSYPSLFTWQGALYLMPETAEARTVEVYRCVRFPDQWEGPLVLMDDIHAVDATMVHHQDRWWLLASVRETAEGPVGDTLSVFWSDAPTHPTWTPHPQNPVVRDVRRARPAGPVFRVGDQLLRPCQDGARRYGYGLRLQRIERLDTRGYAERDVALVTPWADDVVAVHSVSHAGPITVIDARLRLRR